MTHDTVWDSAVASLVKMIPAFRGFRLSGFTLGEGDNNSLTNSVAVGVQGNKDASGFQWPENTITSDWVFNNNIGHNNKVHGIFTWQNGGNFHLVEDFVIYLSKRETTFLLFFILLNNGYCCAAALLKGC